MPVAPDSPLPAATVEAVSLMRARDLAASGAALRIRQAAGLSQRELARAVGVSGPAVQRWELGRRRPRGAAGARYGELLRQLQRELIAG